MDGPARFDSGGADDEQSRRWLALLQRGTPDEKARARRGLAAIFEARGMGSEAIELLVTNAREGHRDAELFQTLARLYRQRGDEYLATSAALEAIRLRAPRAPDDRPAGPPQPPPDTRPSRRPPPHASRPPPRPAPSPDASAERPPPWRLPLRVAGWIVVLGTAGAAAAFSAQHPPAAVLYLVSAASLGLLLAGSAAPRGLLRLPDGPLGDGALLFVFLLALLAAGALLPRPLTSPGSSGQPVERATPPTVGTPSPSPSPVSPATPTLSSTP
jgi:hypothetical protein